MEPEVELPANLPRARLLARAALWWEGAWPAIWPVLAVFAAFAIFALTGLPAVLPAWLHILVLVGFALALLWALRRAARGLAAPPVAAADRRIETATGLDHRPLAALQDRPATRDPAALLLWRAHQQRMRARLGRLRIGAPRPGMAGRDPRALRFGLLIALAAALGVAGADAPALLWRGLVPGFGPTLTPPALRIEAWVTPPAYTGAPPIFLDAAGGAATVPAGSRLNIALSGGTGAAPELAGLTGASFEALGAGSYAAQITLTDPARIAIRRNAGEVAAWRLAVQADAPPTAGFTEPPGRVQRGLALRLPWRAEDDWGVVALRAEFHLAARPTAAPLTLEMTLPAGATRAVRGQALPDLSAHPWAGLAVVLRLIARDGAGQEGLSDEIRLTLPERSFNHPVARALIELRKALSLDPENRTGAMRQLDGIAAAPEAFENDPATLLALRTARGQLQRDRRPEAIPEVQELLWDAALALEEGRDERTARALAEAQRALREALQEQERQNREGAQATPEQQRAQQDEVQRRIAQLREAIRRHMEALAERLQRENAEALPYDPQQRLLDQRDMERRTRRMEEANRQNRPEDAQRELAELEEMLRALQEGRVARGESPERQQQRQRGQQQMGVVQDMVRRQTEMLDQGQRRAEAEEQRQQQQRRATQGSGARPMPTPPGASPQPPAQQPAETQQEARRQRALRRALGELMQQYGDLTGEVPQALGQADQAMREAQEALGQSLDARPAQQEAIRRLQEGGRQMAQQMQRQFGQGQPGEGGEGEDFAEGGELGGEGEESEGERGEGRDPLGRRSRETAGNAENGSDTRLPEEAEMLRTRRIQEELRRRGAERERPGEELDYIERLLRRF
jgi:uncharacterized protein (TIGR02302 family)